MRLRITEFRSWQPLLLIPLVAACACWQLVAHGPSCGHDFDFHLLSWIEAARQWHEGVLYPHWVVSANYGAGEPRFAFYPPLSWMLGALLGMAVGWNTAPVVFTFLALVSCGAGMYWLAREWMPGFVATRAAALYMLTPYSMFVAYERTAYGELLAGVWVPLVVLFALRKRPSAAPLALVFAAAWLTNAPAGVMAGYTLVFVAVTAAIMQRQWWPLLRAAAGASLGLALAAAYLVPAAVERQWVQISRAIMVGLRVQDSYLFEHTGAQFHDEVLRTASWIAVAMLLVTIACAAWLLLKRKEQFQAARPLLLPLVALLPLIFFLLTAASGFVWNHAPELKFLQFPWRWLLVAGVANAVFAAMALRAKSALIAAMLPLLLASLLLTHRFYQVCDSEDSVSGQIATYQQGTGIEGTDEYTPAGADNSAIQKGLPPVRVLGKVDADETDSSVVENPQWSGNGAGAVPASVKIERWAPEEKRLSVDAGRSGFLILKLMDYPAWRVLVNGAPQGTRPRREDGLLVIPVSAGTSQIDVVYAATRDVIVGRSLSAAALACWLALAVWERKRWRRRQVS